MIKEIKHWSRCLVTATYCNVWSLLINFFLLIVIVKIDKIAEINYELIEDPIFNPTYIETQHKVSEFLIDHTSYPHLYLGGIFFHCQTC